MEFLIASYPRSGNTFLRILLRNRYALVSLDPDRRKVQSANKTLGRTALLRAKYDGPDAPAVPTVQAIKTHGLPPNTTDPAVYLVRDGRDALVSYAHHALTFTYNCPPERITPEQLRRTIADLILETRSEYGTWSQNVDAWMARPNTVVVRFEELVANPGGVADRVVADLGLGLVRVNDYIPTFEELKSFNPRFFRRGGGGEWRELFTPELTDLFWEHNGATMTRLGYGDAPHRAAA